MRSSLVRIAVVMTMFAAGVAAAIPLALRNASPAGAAVVLVQHPTRQSTADVPPNTDFVVPWTVAPTAGDTFLVAATNYCSVHPSTTQTITSDPGKWTIANHAAGTTEGGFMFGKLIVWRWTGAGVPGNVTLQMQGATSSCDLDVATFEYRGLTANPVDVNTQASYDGTPAPWTLPTITTTQSNELLFVALGSRASQQPWVNAVTPGFTLEADNATTGGTSNMGIAVADRVVTTAGSYTPVASFCAGCGSHPGAVILGLRIAATGATTTTTTVAPPSCPCNLWPTGVPAVAASADTHAVEVGVKFRSDTAGYITRVRFYKGASNTGVHTGSLWSSTGTLLATATFGGETTSGWQSVAFSTPVRVTAGTTYVASYHSNTGHYAFTYDAFVRQFDHAPLHALASAASGGNGVYVYNAARRFPTLTYRSTNYWVDVAFTATIG